MLCPRRFFKIFLSHSSDDSAIRKDIYDLIESLRDNFRVVFESRYSSTARDDQKLMASTADKIASSNVFLALLSRNAVKNEWVNFEIKKALEYNKIIIPVLIKEDIEEILNVFPWIKELKWIEVPKRGDRKSACIEIVSRITGEYERKMEIDKKKAEDLNKLLFTAIVSIVGIGLFLIMLSEDSG